MLRSLCIALLLSLSATVVAADGPKMVDPWIRATPPNVPTGAAYVTIHGGDTADRLIGAQSTVASSVELHTTMQRDGMMQMMPVPAFDIPPHGTVTLAPGGQHLMLIGLKRSPMPGESIVMTLVFEHAGAVDVKFPVVDARAEGRAGQAER